MTHQDHTIDVLAQGPKLNLLAAIEISDVNEAHLIVHGVLARALNGVVDTTLVELDADLAYALHLYAGRGALNTTLGAPL